MKEGSTDYLIYDESVQELKWQCKKLKLFFFFARISRINCSLVHEVRSKKIAKMP